MSTYRIDGTLSEVYETVVFPWLIRTSLSSEHRHLTDEPVYYLDGISFPVLDHIPSPVLFKPILLCGPSKSGAKSLLTLWRHLGKADVLARLSSIRPILRAALPRPSVTDSVVCPARSAVPVVVARRHPFPRDPFVLRQIPVSKLGLPGRVDQRVLAGVNSVSAENDALRLGTRVRRDWPRGIESSG